VAWLLAMATLREGFNSVAFASLNELTCVDARRAPFAGLGANDLSLAVMGGRRGDKLVQGLKHLGIVVVDERSRIEAAMPLTVWMLITDKRQWKLPADGWLYSASELVEWQMHLRSCRRRHTAALGGLAVDADLKDGLAAIVPMADAQPDAPSAVNGRGTATDGRRSFSSDLDALDVPPMAGLGVLPSRRSESRNAETPAKARCFPNVGMPSRARAVPIWNRIGTETCNSIASLSSEDLKLKLEGGEEDFCRAARQIMGSDWDDGREYYFKGEGAKWRLRWRFKPARATCVRVFLDLISAAKSGGKSANNCWLDFGGASLDAARDGVAPKKKLEDS
jgi:hypothetical protein